MNEQTNDSTISSAAAATSDVVAAFKPEMTERGPIVWGPVDGPLEAPAKEIGSGPLYIDAEEVMPEIGADPAMDANARKKFSFNVDRRDFLKIFGAGAVASSAACVRRPVELAIPYVNQPVDFVPGVANYYATTCGECAAGCGVVVRTREGRPTKLEGNPDHPISQGGLCALGQSGLQALYHPERRSGPMKNNGGQMSASNWDSVYAELAEKMAGKRVAIFTGGATGNRHQFYRDWLKQIGSSEDNLFTYESNNLYGALTQSHAMVYGVEAMPRYDIRAARTLFGIGADFLDVGQSPVFSAKSFAAMHSFQGGTMGKFTQFESVLTQTGGRADFRHVIPPNAELITTLLLVKALAAHSGAKGSAAARAAINKVLAANASVLEGAYDAIGVKPEVFTEAAEELLTKGPGLVMVGGSHSFDASATQLQIAGIMANELCGAYGQTVFIDRGWMTSPVKAGDLKRFMAAAANLDAVIFIDTNPAFTIPAAFGFGDAVKNIGTVVSIQVQPCETDLLAQYVLNGHHYLESWGDEQPVAGFWSARQPAIRATTDSRQAEDVLLWIAAAAKKPMGYSEYRDYLRSKWKSVQALIDAKVEFPLFFNAVLRRGFVGKLSQRAAEPFKDISTAMTVPALKPAGTLALLAPIDPRLHDGRGASRPVLQEVGDGMTSICWDTWVGLNPGTAKKLGLKRNDLLTIEGAGGSVKAGLYPTPGLHPDAVVIHRGNGHATGLSKITDGAGVNPLGLFAKGEDSITGLPVSSGETVRLSRTGEIYRLAAMQKSTDLGNRADIAVKLSVKGALELGDKPVDRENVPNLYKDLYANVEYRWGLSVDLGKCTGCGACQVACSQENNVAQVGREEVLLGRMMHWIRLDRYYRGELDNPQVTFQPMMCQQCTHAPCEAVCPVYATTHEPEGINAMTYNRCIGTRYCANACPYKVRRFNWWTNKWNTIGDRPQDRNLRAMNPDITVRTRGVMEKCNFCFSRIRDAKHRAKERGNKVQDGEIRVACEQTCPSDAMVFGNLKDQMSRVSQLRADARSYLALNGEPGSPHFGLKTMPNVNYVSHISHAEPAGGNHHAASEGTHHG